MNEKQIENVCYALGDVFGGMDISNELIESAAEEAIKASFTPLPIEEVPNDDERVLIIEKDGLVCTATFMDGKEPNWLGGPYGCIYNKDIVGWLPLPEEEK